MAYEHTSVAVAKSQDKIRQLILRNRGLGVAFVSQPPLEGFEAQVSIDGKTYHVRITATCKHKDHAADDKRQQEERRVWRVLFHHLKSVYEAANTGVMEFRELMLPYVVTSDGRTIADHILPRLDAAIAGNPARLLSGKIEAKP